MLWEKMPVPNERNTKKLSACKAPPKQTDTSWTFLTNHTHVLLCLAKEPEMRMRDVAQVVGITERAVQRIVRELEQAGYISRIRLGRRNSYQIRGDLPLRHPVEMHVKVSSLLAFVQHAKKFSL